MTSENQEDEIKRLREELAKERWKRDMQASQAEIKAYAREQKASTNTALIVLFGSIAIIFLSLLF
jgi:molecular chaperone GrpE (heat shock protein)